MFTSSLEKPGQSSSSKSGGSFFHSQTSITGFTVFHTQDMPYIASSTALFSPEYYQFVIFISKGSGKASPVVVFIDAITPWAVLSL
jgi:hypothetical protein